MAEQASERVLLAAEDGGVEGVSAELVHHLGHVRAVPEQRLLIVSVEPYCTATCSGDMLMRLITLLHEG